MTLFENGLHAHTHTLLLWIFLLRSQHSGCHSSGISQETSWRARCMALVLAMALPSKMTITALKIKSHNCLENKQP